MITGTTKHKKYRDFTRSQMDMPIFSKDWFLDAVYDEAWDVVTVERNNEIVASLPFVLKKKGFFKIINHHFFTQTMGPFIRPDYRNPKQELKLMKELINALPECAGFDQHFHYSITNWLPFKWEGYQETTSYTYVLEDITDTQKIWDGFISDYKNKIEKAKTVVEIVDDRSLEDFYNTAKLTFDRQGKKMIYDLDFLERFDSRLYMESRNKIFFAQDRKTGEIHAVLYMTLGDEAAHMHLAGANPELRNSNAGIYLVWHAIQYASEKEKLKKFDFQGSVIPQIERVHRNCGAIQKPFFRVWKHHSRMFRMLKGIKG